MIRRDVRFRPIADTGRFRHRRDAMQVQRDNTVIIYAAGALNVLGAIQTFLMGKGALALALFVLGSALIVLQFARNCIRRSTDEASQADSRLSPYRADSVPSAKTKLRRIGAGSSVICLLSFLVLQGPEEGDVVGTVFVLLFALSSIVVMVSFIGSRSLR